MTGVVPVAIDSGRPLAPMQRALWTSQRLHPGAPVQNMALLTHFGGPIDPERLAEAFETVIGRADVLRTRIVETGSGPLVRLDATPQERSIIAVDRARAGAWAAARVSTPIDVSVRAYDSAILVHDDGTASWYLALHHTITDAASSALVFDATAAVYHGQPVELGSYYRWAARAAAAAGATEGAAAAKRARRAAAHWRDRPATPAVDRLYRPLERPGSEAARLDIDLDGDLAEAAAARLGTDYELLSPDLGWTALLMTATSAYLSSLSGSDAFSIGLPVHNRSDPETRELIGPIMEVFPVDVAVEPGRSFRSLHSTIGRAILSTLANAVPGTAPPADYSAVVNVIARAGVGSFGSVPTSTRWVHSGAIDSSHLLRVQYTAYDQRMALDLNRAVADDRHVDRAADHFRSILEAMVADPDRPVGGPRLGPAEEAEITAWESAADFPTPTPGLVGVLREDLASRMTPALRDGNRSWTGAELWDRVCAVADWLRAHGVGPGDRVGIDLPRSAEAVIGILATLVAGGSFVPLDAAQPPHRRRRLAERAGAVVVLSSLPEAGVAPGRRDQHPDPAPGQEAYLLFTSGSTGEPKGVPITHGGLARYIRFAAESYLDRHRGEGPVVPLFSSLGFDLTMTSLFLPLVTGGELVVIRPDGGPGLSELAATPDLTWCKATPSHLDVLVRLLPPDHALRTLVVGGEAFGAGLARRLLDLRPDLAVFNEYGPTEAVVGCMIHRVDPARLDHHREVPIGRPAPGVTLRVVGPDLARVPLGSSGELLISHAGLTSGYLRAGADDGEGSAGRSPFVELDGRRFYRSGDLVRLADPDTLIYLGRIDEQVKVGGIRLEPTEVSEAIVAHPAIGAAAVRIWSPSPAEVSTRCVRCGLASNVPGATFDATGVCSSCHDYDRVAPQVRAWFRTVDDLEAKRDEARRRRRGPYDCIHLLSGGKDSTYALYRLVDLGFEPFVLTLDNGFISEEAKANIRRSVADLGLDHEFATTEAMNEIFRDSLERHSNVCHGCYKTLYTLATNRAVELGIPMIVTGLSRGQLFETRLLPQQFSPARFDPDAIDRAVLEARKTYHRLDDGPNRLLDTTVFETDDVFERVEYVDFYRYVDVELAELYAYLDANAPWVRPSDTGRSTNCLINAAGIHTHLREQGYHNYAIPYAWDVRLGHKTRAEAIAELDDQLELDEVERLLATVGYSPTPPTTLTAWIEPTPGFEVPSPAELRAFLSESLPAHAIPRAFVAVDRLPLTTNGKLDTAALPAPDRTHRPSTGIQVAAETELEATIVAVWERILRIEPIGVDDDFFALGGDSLAALEMSLAVGEATGRELADDVAFVDTTPRELAAAIATSPPAEDAPVDTSPRPAPPSGPSRWTAADPPPLSEGELSILYEQSARPDEVMYNVGRLYRVAGSIDVARFTAAIETVAAGHVPLSWTFGAPRVELDPARAVVFDIAAEAVDERRLDDEARRFHRAPLDPARGPLLKVMIRPLVDGSTAVLLVCHHVSGDAESFDRLWPQIDAAYSGRPIPSPTIDYPTFTEWQRTTRTDADRAHWLASDPGRVPAALGLGPPLPGTDDGFVTIEASVSPRQLGARAGTSAFAVAVAALTATLRRYSDGDAIDVEMIASSRDHARAEGLVGYFLNTLPVGLDCPPDDRLDDLLDRASTTIAGNLAHRSYPYARIVADRRQAGIEPPANRILVAYQKLPTTSLAGRPVSQTVLSNGTAVTDATFFVEERDDRIVLSLEYRGSFMDRGTATAIVSDLDAVLRAAIERPTSTVAAVPLPSSGGSVLTGDDLVAPDSLLPLIANHLETGADHPAVECGDRTLSWSQLDRRSGELAARLRAHGIGRGDRVIVALPRSVDLVAAIVAVLRRGAAYVPIDPTYPPDRIATIVEGAGARAALIAGPGPTGHALTAVDLTVDDEPPAGGGGDPDGGPGSDPGSVRANDLAYVIFTSGSTGRPRGVPVTHGQLAASTMARAAFYDAAPERFLVLSSAAFDSSIVGLFWTLVTGGTIVVPTDGESHDPDAVLELFAHRSLSHVLLVPTLYQVLLDRAAPGGDWPRHVIVAGEACSAALAERHVASRPSSALTNEYGPTEATVWATAHHVTAGEDPVPIGGPIPGTWVAVVDGRDRPVPAGVAGELIIGGAGVVDGYDGDPATTAARFGTGDRGRFFRTGDRARIVDGRVRYLGRIDHQLNVGGARAEPEDIERVLLADPAVGAAIVTAADLRPLSTLIDDADPTTLASAMARAAATGDPATALRRLLRADSGPSLRLVAHLEPAGGWQVDLDRVRAIARDRLPALLRPTAYALHPALPRSPNGKIDRAAAAELEVEPPSSVTTIPPTGPDHPTTTQRGDAPTETARAEELARQFAATLGLERVAPDESFFDLGGHSLLAMELLLALEQRFGVDITVTSLYENPTPARLGALIDRLAGSDEQYRYLVPIQPHGTKSPIFAVHVLGVNSEFVRPLAARLGPDQPVFGLGQPTLEPDTSTPTEVAEIAELYRRELTRCAPTGPVSLAAVSLGSVVAFELAQQLRAAGRTVALLILFDAVGPDAAESAPTPGARLATHVRELARSPSGYARDRARRIRDRARRRVEIAACTIRLALGLPIGDDLRIRRFIEDNWRSQLVYHFRPYDGAVLVFKAGDDPFTASLTENQMGWRSVVRGRLDVIVTPGGHLSMLAEPHVGTLAERLATANDAATTAAAATPAADPPPAARVGPSEIEADLVEALAGGTFGVAVARWLASDARLTPEGRALLAAADETTRSLAAAAEVAGAEALAALTAAGVAAETEPVPERLQHLSVGIRLLHPPADGGDAAHRSRAASVRADVTAAVAALGRLGYRLQDPVSEGGWQAYLRAQRSCTLVRGDESTSRIVLSWTGRRRPGRWHPQRADLLSLDLPGRAWPLYHLVRPLRLARDRIRGRGDGDLGVFVGTPRSLVDEILGIAEPTADDVLVDLGCGDGRVLIEAASRFGCRGRGIELDPDLAAAARAAAARAGLGDRVEIVEGDAGRLDLDDATIAFAFLPVETVARILPRLLDRLPAGGRVVAHEQLGARWPIAPDVSRLVIGSGITVAHRWNR